MRIQYTKSSDGVSLAYQVLSEAGPSLLCVPGAISNLLFADADPTSARSWEGLSRFCRVIRYDKRGTGLSDRAAASLNLADQVQDIEAIRRATKSDAVALSGLSQGAAVSILYALAHPECVTHLLLVEGICCDARNPDAPPPTEPLFDWEELFADVEGDFEKFSRRLAEMVLPAIRPEWVDFTTDFLRATASPQSLRSLFEGIIDLDLRPVLADLAVPTLVLHARGDRVHPVAHGRYLATHIPDARYVELATDAHVPYMDETVAREVLATVEEFLTGSVHHTADRRFACVLFADIVNSTEEQRMRGDRGWRDLLAAWEGTMRRLAEQYRGRIVKFQGDALMAAFSTPSEALRAARVMVTAARELGLDVRAGLHAGEVYEADGDLFGTCVNTAARVCDLAECREVLATSVIGGLVEGSDLRLEDRGEVELRGIGTRRLLRLS